jgi:predicted tellurium resistance membrane protein TerC
MATVAASSGPATPEDEILGKSVLEQEEHAFRGTSSTIRLIFTGVRLPKHLRLEPGTMNVLLRLVTDPAAWVALATLIVMEVVLGIDNLVFIAILSNRLPERNRGTTRTLGIALAMVLRLALLSCVAFIVGLTRPVVTVSGFAFSWRDLILITGGLFLIWKATREIHEAVDPEADNPLATGGGATIGVAAGLLQILLLDLVFSVDSILTAVGMTDKLPVMMAAVVVAVVLMMIASGPLAAFIRNNPSVVMLALGFLLLIGALLVADGLGFHMPRGYVYAAMGFSGFVEALNMLARRRRRAKGQAK